jgi:GNAT superfamily N-acetyltransferase
MSIQIHQVTDRKGLQKFLKFPYKLYNGHSFWVPPLLMDEKDTHNPQKNPAFEQAKSVYFLAHKNGEIVGRIAGIIVEAEAKDKKLARFGWIDFIDDEEVSSALINAVENWAKKEGLIGLHGPMGFCDMDPNGMLVDGFDSVATMATTYHPAYAHKHIQKLGYLADAEWIEFEGNLDFEFGEKDFKRTNFIKERFGLEVFEPKRQKDYLVHGKDMFRLINETYADLYGFYPLSNKQIEYYISKYLKFVRLDYFCMILKEGKLIGFGIGMPSFSQALQKNNGRLLPFGWINMLRAFKNDEIVDLYLVSADPEYARLGITRLLFFEIFNNLKKNGCKFVHTNPVLQTNTAAKGMWSSPLATEKDVRIRKKRQVFIKKFE